MAQINDTPQGQIVEWVTGQDALLIPSEESSTGSDTLAELSSLESLQSTESEYLYEWETDSYSDYYVSDYSGLFASGVVWGFGTALCVWAFARAAAIPWNIFEKITKGGKEDV